MSHEQPVRPGTAGGSISRRDLLRRSAVVGAVAWSVPVVQMLASPAFGQTAGSPAPADHDAEPHAPSPHGAPTP